MVRRRDVLPRGRPRQLQGHEGRRQGARHHVCNLRGAGFLRYRQHGPDQQDRREYPGGVPDPVPDNKK